MKSVSIRYVCFTLVALAAPCAGAQDALPSGQDLAEAYIAALGGRDALEAIETRVTHSTINMGGRKGTTVTYAKRPGKVRTEIEFADGSTVTRVRNGGVVWEQAGDGTPRRVEGEMGRLLEALMTFDALENQDAFDTKVTEGVETVNEVVCYRVRYEREDIKPLFVWFDKQSGLPVKSRIELPIADRHLSAESAQGDYRSIDGVLVPFEIRESTPLLNTLTNVVSIHHNEAINDDLFALPESLK